MKTPVLSWRRRLAPKGAGRLRACRVSNPGVALADPHSPRRRPPLQMRAHREYRRRRACRMPEPAAASSAGGRPATRACSASMAARRSFQAALRRPAATSSPASAASASSASARDSAPLCRAARARQRAPSRPGARLGPEPASRVGPSALPGGELGRQDTRALRRSSALCRQRCRALPACSALKRRGPGLSQGAGACASYPRSWGKAAGNLQGGVVVVGDRRRRGRARRGPRGLLGGRRRARGRRPVDVLRRERLRRIALAAARLRAGEPGQGGAGRGRAAGAARGRACGGAERGRPRAPWRSG